MCRVYDYDRCPSRKSLKRNVVNKIAKNGSDQCEGYIVDHSWNSQRRYGITFDWDQFYLSQVEEVKNLLKNWYFNHFIHLNHWTHSNGMLWYVMLHIGINKLINYCLFINKLLFFCHTYFKLYLAADIGCLQGLQKFAVL